MSKLEPIISNKQQKRLIELWEAQQSGKEAWIGYWCSDAWGRSANGGDQCFRVEPGMVQTVEGELTCCPSGEGEVGLHATKNPHKWEGNRVWLVALLGVMDIGRNKRAAKKREIIAEMVPGGHIKQQVYARQGMANHLWNPNLKGSNLKNADLRDSDLIKADLSYSNLRYSDLRNSNMRHSDLRHSNMRHSDLRHSNMRSTNLIGSDLRYSDLRYSDLGDSDLRYSDLRYSDLRYSDLGDSDLRKAKINKYTKLPKHIDREALNENTQ